MLKKALLTKILMVMLVLIFPLFGCASKPKTTSLVSNVPVQVISRVNSDSTKVSSLTNTVYLGIFGQDSSFPSIAETARSGGITQIATVEYYTRPGFLMLYREYTTIVTGK